MSHRNFYDRQRNRWEVRVSSRAEWRFEPLPGNPNPPRLVRPPLYAGDDPFELSEQELQTIFGTATPEARAEKKAQRASPFGDAYEPQPHTRKSPFLDDIGEG
ncbi:hypothetical protein [Candidatus Palauibacter sp.]|uniref:hypothetical protein n=1 Tax=Candidatus Palauibacter sp. TaxID=3101350 RepID=UPI003AF2FA50